MRGVYITKQWVNERRDQIDKATCYNSLANGTPRRRLVERARIEFRYSENTLPIDIWNAIVRVFYEN